MKRIVVGLLVLIIVSLLWELYHLYLLNQSLGEDLTILEKRVAAFTDESAVLQADLTYFAEPENLLKELRARFNYKKPGEKLIIIVSPENIASTTITQ